MLFQTIVLFCILIIFYLFYLFFFIYWISNYDKLRLLLLYIICYDGVPQDDLRKLVEHAHIRNSELDIISNFKYLGANLKSSTLKDLKPKRGYDSMWEKEKVKRKLNKRDDEESYELSRYISTLKYVIEVIIIILKWKDK